MKAWLLLVSLLWAAPAPAAPVRVEAAPESAPSGGERPLPLRTVGRVGTIEEPGGTVRHVHQWPGVYFETTFTGGRLSIGFDDPDNEYRLLVDDQAPVALKPRGRAWCRVTGLAAGPHRVRLEKVTESVDYRGAFLGFHAPEGSKPGALGGPTRRIEFIGDSSMTGYGNRSATRQCTKDEVRDTTDTQQAYPALAAKAAGADYQVNAISGRGLVRNYEGTLPGHAMADVYPRLFFQGDETYDFAGWKPQIVVIKLNADFFAPLRPDEAWPSLPSLAEAYIARFEAFVAELHRRSPGAALLIWWPDPATLTDPGHAAMAKMGRDRIAAAAAAAGVRHIDFLAPGGPPFEIAACDYHLTLADHRRLAAWFSAYLLQHPEYWDGN